MNLTSYSRDEIVSVSQLARNLKKILDDLESKKKKKFGIAKNNKIRAVLVPVEFLEELEELIEHMEIHEIVQREKSKNQKLIPFEKIKSEYGL